MNVQDAGLAQPEADRGTDRLLMDRGSLFQERTDAVAAAAARDADDVDLKARFPKATFDAAREHKLLGMLIPVTFGGLGGSVHDVTEVCYTLGRACASNAMLFPMHQTKVARLGRHGSGSDYPRQVIHRVAAE